MFSCFLHRRKEESCYGMREGVWVGVRFRGEKDLVGVSDVITHWRSACVWVITVLSCTDDERHLFIPVTSVFERPFVAAFNDL